MRKLFLSLFLISAVCTIAFTQVAPPDPGGMTWEIVLMILGVIGSIIVIILRLIPTGRNWDILHFILKIIDALVPNRAKSGIDGNDKAVFKIGKIKIKRFR